MKQIILASSSPRRKELLEKTGITFSVHPSNFEESIDPNDSPEETAKKLSQGKANDVAKFYTDAVIIGADTLVALKNQIFGKPKNLEDAKQMLHKLSGKTHRVITGFTIFDVKTNKQITESVSTFVTFKNISSEQIAEYVEFKKPLDKSGSYGIQEIGESFLEKVEGDIQNVMGLPIENVKKILQQFDLTQ